MYTNEDKVKHRPTKNPLTKAHNLDDHYYIKIMMNCKEESFFYYIF